MGYGNKQSKGAKANQNKSGVTTPKPRKKQYGRKKVC